MVHVVVMVMVMMMVMVMVMVHGVAIGAAGGAPAAFLRDGVAGEAERENGRGGKGLDHGRSFLWLANPNGSGQAHRDLRLNSI